MSSFKNKGGAIIAVMAAMVLLLILGIGLLASGLDSRIWSIRAAGDIAARAAADAGVTEALAKLKIGSVSTNGTIYSSPSLPNNATYTYSVIVESSGPYSGCYRIESNGKQNKSTRTVRCWVQKGGAAPFIMVDRSMVFGSGCISSAIDSSKADPNQVPSGMKPDMVFNNTSIASGTYTGLGNNVVLGANWKYVRGLTNTCDAKEAEPVLGDIYAGTNILDRNGQNGQFTGSWQKLGEDTPNTCGTYTDGANPALRVVMPSVTTGMPTTSKAGITIAANTTVTFPSASYPSPCSGKYGFISGSPTIALKFTGPNSKLVISEPVQLASDYAISFPGETAKLVGTEIRIIGSGSLELWPAQGSVTSTYKVNNLTKRPRNFTLRTNKSLTLTSDSDIYGVIIARSGVTANPAIVTMDSGTKFWGAIMADKFGQDFTTGNQRIYFDWDLLNSPSILPYVPGAGTSDLKFVGWQDLP